MKTPEQIDGELMQNGYPPVGGYSRRWEAMAKLVRTKRSAIHESTEDGLSQNMLSEKLGYKNGQFVSNVERALCTIPLAKAKILCEILNINPVDFAEAYMQDERDHVKHHLGIKE